LLIISYLLNYPFINRYEEEYLERILDRVFYFVLDTMYDEKTIPDAVKAIPGFKTKVEYTAPLAKTHRARQLESTVTFLQLMQTIAQSDPTILGVLKQENLVGMMTDLLGVPFQILKTRDELAEDRKISEQKQMVEMLMQSGPALGKTANNTASGMKDLAQAAQIGMQGIGNP
jgi:hypothetical protein